MTMQNYLRFAAISIVLLFVGSLMVGFVSNYDAAESEVLSDEPVIQNPSQASSPGHVVFGQYISSDNCGHCSKPGGGSDAHHSIKQNHPDDYVYITYMSASFGDTDTSRAGNVAPYNWVWSRSGAPDAYFGDRTDKNQGGANSAGTTYDSLFQSGGGMHSTVNDYSMSAGISQTGGNYNIDISYRYTGSGSPAGNMKLYAALVDKDCTGYSYSSGIPHGYNCWMAWLTAGNTYKSKSSGSGSAFESVSVSSTSQTSSWTSVPSSVVPGGLNKAIVIGVLMSGNTVSVGGSSPHVYHAIDSTMGPKMDLSIPSFTVTSPAGSSYKRGDILTLDATVANSGDLDYTSGGSVDFYYVLNGAKNYIGQSASIGTLTTTGASRTMTTQQTFDTSVLPENGWKTVFGVELSTTGESITSNNRATTELDHDRPPKAKTPQIIGSTEINRGIYVSILAKGDADDNVDSIDSMSFDVEISPRGANQWSSDAVTGGFNILYLGSPNEGKEYSVLPTVDMASGFYDIRTRTVDARGQTSNWATAINAFNLMNAPPSIIPNQVSPVVCDQSTRVDLTGIVTDPETPLSDLLISSSSSSFVAWHAATTEIEVKFAWDAVQGCPLGQQGIEVTMDDGGDYSSQGQLPYGTLLFNVLENGQPRWQALPTQIVDEASTGTFSLLPYLSDTDAQGNAISADQLSLSIMSESTTDVFVVELDGTNLVFSTVDDDVNGEALITLRASDGEQFADQTILLKVNPINDAPRLDLTGIDGSTQKVGIERTINLMELLTDVDNPKTDTFITVSSQEEGAAKYNPIDGTMTLKFQSAGPQVVTMTTVDRQDSNSYTITIDVYDSYPLYITKIDDGSGHFYVDMDNTYIGLYPTANIFLTDLAPTFKTIETTWQLCNEETGTCDGLYDQTLDVSRSLVGWNVKLDMPSVFMPGELARPSGSEYKDYYQLTITAVDSNDDEYKTLQGVKWDILDDLPEPSEMSDEFLATYTTDLKEDIDSLKDRIESNVEGEDTSVLEERLAEKQASYDAACEDPRASCPIEQTQSAGEEDESSEINWMLILSIVGILNFLVIAGLLFLRSGSSNDGFKQDLAQWDQNTLPIHDTVANSMYGGAAPIFQQPIAQPAPLPQQPVQPAPLPLIGPPLPPGGLPAGWTIEQWQYYGQQYLDTLLQR